jgi:hypothetical protein
MKHGLPYLMKHHNWYIVLKRYRSPCGLVRRSQAAWLLGSRVRISITVWMLVPCVCVEYVTASATSWSPAQGIHTARARACVCVCVCDLEASKMRRPRPQLGSCPAENKELVLNLPVFWTRLCADLCINATVLAFVLVRMLWQCHVLHMLPYYVHTHFIPSHFQWYKH